MKRSLLAHDLRRKAERALASARELQDRDPDGSVNRSYYAMFDIARAALLKAGIAEDDLPRTHRGVISAFSKHAVQSGRIDQQMSGALGRTESFRLMATQVISKPVDYASHEAFATPIRSIPSELR